MTDAWILFIAGCRRGAHTMVDLYRRHGINRKTGYEWLQRYRQDQARVASAETAFDFSKLREYLTVQLAE